MKQISLYVLAFVFIAFNIQAQTTYPSGVPGCIARWTFDTTDVAWLDTLPDMSANNNHGSVTNIASVPGFRNKPHSAGSFDGATSFAKVMNSTKLNPSEITIISLVYIGTFNDTLCQGNQIISKGYPYFIDGNYGQALNDNPYDNDCNNFNPNFTQLITQIGPTPFTVSAGNYINLNKWYFFASTIGNNSIKQYQVKVDTFNILPSLSNISNMTGTFSINTNTQNITIGHHLNPNYPYWLHGKIDEIVLFNRVLSPTEIHSVYTYLCGYPTSVSANEVSNFFTYKMNNKFIECYTELMNYKFEVFNNTGQLVFAKNNCFKNEIFDLSKYSSNIYHFRISTNQKTFTFNSTIY